MRSICMRRGRRKNQAEKMKANLIKAYPREERISVMK